MDTLSNLLSRLFLTIALISFCAYAEPAYSLEKNLQSDKDVVPDLARILYEKKDAIKGKNIAIEYFRDIDGKECQDGIVISQRLLSFCQDTYSDLQFVNRSDIQIIIKYKELELSGLVDTTQANETSLQPVHIVISGTIISLPDHTELFIKATDISSGIILTSVTFCYPSQASSKHYDEKKIASFKENPEKYDQINKTFTLLQHTAQHFPIMFLAVMTDKNDPHIKQHSFIAKKIKSRLMHLKQNFPKRFERFKKLKTQINIIAQSDPSKYAELLKLKEKIITSLTSEKK